MTYDIGQLRELERRLSEATPPGPADTDELGVAVYETLGICSYIPDEGDPTRSLDAAIALVERVLPGWGIELRLAGSRDGEWHWNARVIDPSEPDEGEDYRTFYGTKGDKSPALALCLALVRALIAKEGK